MEEKPRSLESLGSRQIPGYRVKTIRSGQMLECEIYPLWNTRQGACRVRNTGLAVKPRENLNDKKPGVTVRLINTNFTSGPWITVTSKHCTIGDAVEQKLGESIHSTTAQLFDPDYDRPSIADLLTVKGMHVDRLSAILLMKTWTDPVQYVSAKANKEVLMDRSRASADPPGDGALQGVWEQDHDCVIDCLSSETAPLQTM